MCVCVCVCMRVYAYMRIWVGQHDGLERVQAPTVRVGKLEGHEVPVKAKRVALRLCKPAIGAKRQEGSRKHGAS